MKLKLIIFLSIACLFFSSGSFGYQNKKAILLVNKSLQPDSLGYNIVSSYLELVYYLVRENKIKLWDSPLKSYLIDFDNLKGLEQNQELSFTKAENFFIYEYWSVSSGHSSFNIVGFGFSAANKQEKEVSLGYVDFNDILPFLKANYVSITINGFCQTTFYQVFMNKAFSYDLIYFDDAPVITKTGAKAEKQYLKGNEIKNKAFGSKAKNLNAVEIIPCKTITYEIRNFDYDSGAYLIFKTLEDFVKSSKDIFRFYAGEDIYTLFRNNKPLITKCEVTEMLRLEGGQIRQYLLKLTPQVFGKTFYSLTPANLDTLNLTIDAISLQDYLLQHRFRLYLIEINDIPVNPADTRANMDALFSGRFRNFRPEVIKAEE